MAADPGIRGEGGPVTRHPASRPAMQRRLLALTRDPVLTQALQDLAAGNELDVLVVDDLPTLTDELMQTGAPVALVDATALDAPADAVIDAIATQFPDLRLMVAGHGAEQTLLASRIADQSVFRFVHKPASSQRLKLFLDAAASQPPRPRVEAPVVAIPARAPARRTAAAAGRPTSRLVVAALTAVVLAAGAAYLLWPDDAPDSPPPTTAPVAATPAAPQIETLLQRAGQAFAAGHFVAADGTSAAELYRDARNLDPGNSAAVEGFARAIDSGLQAAEAALLAGRLVDAGTLAETVRLIAPDNSRLAFLNTQIARETTRASADASQRQNIEQRREQIGGALQLMDGALRRGALIEPLTSSALAYFREAEAVSAGDPAVRAARETLVGTLLTAADNELGARRLTEARRLVDAAASVHSSAPGLDVVRRRIDEIATQSVAVREPAPAPPVPEATPAPSPAAEPAVDAAPPPAPAAAPTAPPAAIADTVVSANALKLVRRADPVYPPRALDQLISGWVEMEFTVAKDGSVTDVVVIRAEPERIFDTAAVNAMKRYRYAPVLRNGEAVTQRARLRMRFTAQD